MATARSAARTCGLERSAAEYTATASSFSSWQARTMRRAISPRFAIRTRRMLKETERTEKTERTERFGLQPLSVLSVFSVLSVRSLSASPRRIPEKQQEAAAEESVESGGAVVDFADVLDPGRPVLAGGLEQLGDA